MLLGSKAQEGSAAARKGGGDITEHTLCFIAGTTVFATELCCHVALGVWTIETALKAGGCSNGNL